MAENVLDKLSILMVVPSMVQGRFLQREIDSHALVNVRSCVNVEQALLAMSSLKPDLVISSMYFEDGDGLSLIGAMRANPEFENILFMLVSSEERFDVLDPIRQSGVLAVLPKPFKSEDIKQALAQTFLYLAEGAEVESSLSIGDMQVLVVDDSRLARKHLLKVLAKLGVNDSHVMQAEDGHAAIELLKKYTFNLVLTDYNMPVLDGEGLLCYVREQEGLAHLPVIMITSERNEQKLASIQTNGVTALLDKPFDPSQLKTLLATCV